MKEINNLLLNNISYRFPKIDSKNYVYPKNYYNSKILLDNNKYYILKNKGKRSCLWFTYIEKKLITILILLNSNNLNDSSNEFYDINIDFDNTLCFNNVLLYGFYFKNNNINYFVIDNVYNYNIFNNIITSNNYNNIFNNKIKLFSYIIPNIYSNVNFKITLPDISHDYNNLVKYLYNNKYSYHNISFYSYNKYLGNYLISNIDKTNNFNKINATFKVIPCINEDIYSLFVYENNKETFYDLALIDTYENSVFMNNLFRNIKENKNLDALEESDSEEEFENTNIDKFVNLNKSLNILCSYNQKFKKWIPKKISNEKIIEKNKLLILAKK